MLIIGNILQVSKQVEMPLTGEHVFIDGGRALDLRGLSMDERKRAVMSPELYPERIIENGKD